VDLEYAVYGAATTQDVFVDDGLQIYRNGVLIWSGYGGSVWPRFTARKGDSLRFVAYDDQAHGRRLSALYLFHSASNSVQFLASEHPLESFTDLTWHPSTFYDATFTIQIP
jgi:hypothetical protein